MYIIYCTQDLILAELLLNQKDWVVGYHDHDSLLEKRPDEDLSEDERKAAWDEYEREKQGYFLYNYAAQNRPIPQISGQYLQGPRLNPIYNQYARYNAPVLRPTYSCKYFIY